MKPILRHIPSLLLAMCFVVSGWLKGKDLYATVFETVGIFPRMGLERLCGRLSLGMVRVSLCRGVVPRAAPVRRHVPQGRGLVCGGGDVCLTCLNDFLRVWD